MERDMLNKYLLIQIVYLYVKLYHHTQIGWGHNSNSYFPVLRDTGTPYFSSFGDGFIFPLRLKFWKQPPRKKSYKPDREMPLNQFCIVSTRPIGSWAG